MRLYDIYDMDQGKLIGPRKSIRQIIQLFGFNVARMLQKEGKTTYGKYRIEKSTWKGDFDERSNQ